LTDPIRLEELPQLEVFQYLIGKYVDVGVYFTNPTRVDKNPGCVLKWYGSILLMFDGRRKPFTCISLAIKISGLKHYEISKILYKKFVLRHDIFLESSYAKIDDKRKFRINSNSKILYTVKSKWSNRCKSFWKKRDFTPKMLKEDNVVEVESYQIINDNWNNSYYPIDICIGYCCEDRIKLYFPERKKGAKFISTLRKTDFHIWKGSDRTLLAKAYKDGRLIHNLTGMTVIATQSECVPDVVMFIDYVLFDNDVTGIEMSKKVADRYFCKELRTPDPYKDFDEYYVNDKENAISWLKNNIK
jgi:hypothetical protein